MFKKVKFLLVSVMTLFATLASAQVTTASLSGKVVADGEDVIGATIQAVHTPSGTYYGTITNMDGRFMIQGMRTGGPYRVEVSYVGYQTVVYTDVQLSLGETLNLDVTLQSGVELNEVIVTGTRSKFTNIKTGASTNISNTEMMNMPTVNRSIADLTKLSPYSNGMSFAGGDGRSTNFTVDGANFNNNFGLSSNLPGGGTPISIDAIEEMQIVVAPYDVRQSNFVGGGINAVTKSGTNTFKGTAYGYYTNQNFRGNRINGESLGAREKESRKTYGFTLGGPIIKNKLFFFVNFESNKEPKEIIQYRPSADKISVLQQIKNKLVNDYGYDPGSWDSYNGGNENTKYLARIDWNITDRHKLALRFNKTNNDVWNTPNGNSCDDNYRNRGFNRASEVSTAFSNNMYTQKNNVTSFAGELNSRFNDKISNQLIVTHTNIDDQRGSNSALFPHIDIMSGDISTGNFIPYASLGYELFSYNNGVTNKTTNVTDNFTYYNGKHKITAGFLYEYMTATNSYMRNGTGYYRFATVDDFLQGNTPLSFALTYGFDGNPSPAGVVTYNQYGVYAQDDWNITPRFKLNYGLRADALVFDNDKIVTNNAIKNYDLGGRSIDTGKYPSTHPQISPRIGFNWDIRGDKTLVLRGGTGLFMGRLPLVFFTNMPQYSGTIQGSISKGIYSSSIKNGQVVYTDAQRETLSKLVSGGKVVTDTNEMIRILGLPTSYDPNSTALGSQSYISGVDPDFKMPQIWKSSIAIDYQIPASFPLTLTGEFMYNKTIYGTIVSDWNINTSAVEKSGSRFSGPDNRFDYSGVTNATYGSTSAYVMTNTKKGYGWNANITLKAQPTENLNLMLSYTKTESKEITGMPGSAANSTYTGLYTVNGAEFTGLQRSQYVIPDKVLFNFNWFIPFKNAIGFPLQNILKGEGVHINAIYTAYSPRGYSYIYSNDMNGDGNSADLMYIPKDKNELVFTSDADRDAFWTFLEQDKYLSSHKGEYAEANVGRSPWVHMLDLRVSEDFTFQIGKTKHTIELSCSFQNVLNMINSKWGVEKFSCYQTSNDINVVSPLKYAGKNDAGQPTFSFNKVNNAYPTETFNKYYTNTNQTWHVLFGLKYKFN